MEDIDKLVIKLKVLDNKINKLESLANEVVREVDSVFKKKIRELDQKRETILNKLVQIQDS